MVDKVSDERQARLIVSKYLAVRQIAKIGQLTIINRIDETTSAGVAQIAARRARLPAAAADAEKVSSAALRSYARMATTSPIVSVKT